MIKIGFIGWRGLVGTVLLNRLKNSFLYNFCDFYLFSTNKIFLNKNIFNAFDIKILLSMDIIICCQGSNYTKNIIKKIFNYNWKGYWIDSSSYMRMYNECSLILDPINKNFILKDIYKKRKIFSGANCTVSIALILLKNLIDQNLIDWVFTSSYQAISGAGSILIKKIIKEIKLSNDLDTDLTEIEKKLKINFFNNNPLLFNAIPWIDKKVFFSQSKEEWKSSSESSKIIKKKIKINSNCVRIASLRCHSQFLCLKLKKNINLNDFYNILNNNFIKIIKNNEINSKNFLNPYYVSGKLKIFVGRIKKSNIDNKIYTMFGIGDQLLWGAAEPIKRFLEILVETMI